MIDSIEDFANIHTQYPYLCIVFLMIFYTKSLSELESMIEKLIDELRKIDLCLNAKKTKILR